MTNNECADSAAHVIRFMSFTQGISRVQKQLDGVQQNVTFFKL